MTRDVVDLYAAVTDLRERLAAAERALDRLRKLHPCPACTPAGGACTIPCEECDDTGVATPRPADAGERVIA